jgi:hypothetical protein
MKYPMNLNNYIIVEENNYSSSVVCVLLCKMNNSLKFDSVSSDIVIVHMHPASVTNFIFVKSTFYKNKQINCTSGISCKFWENLHFA